MLRVVLFFNPPTMSSIPNISISPAAEPNYRWEEDLLDEGSKAKRSVTDKFPQNEGQAEQWAKEEILIGHYRDSMRMLSMTPEDILIAAEEGMNDDDFVN
jgi:hypothetical protein